LGVRVRVRYPQPIQRVCVFVCVCHRPRPAHARWKESAARAVLFLLLSATAGPSGGGKWVRERERGHKKRPWSLVQNKRDTARLFVSAHRDLCRPPTHARWRHSHGERERERKEGGGRAWSGASSVSLSSLSLLLCCALRAHHPPTHPPSPTLPKHARFRPPHDQLRQRPRGGRGL